jgi:hypothetical protein
MPMEIPDANVYCARWFLRSLRYQLLHSLMRSVLLSHIFSPFRRFHINLINIPTNPFFQDARQLLPPSSPIFTPPSPIKAYPRHVLGLNIRTRPVTRNFSSSPIIIEPPLPTTVSHRSYRPMSSTISSTPIPMTTSSPELK